MDPRDRLNSLGGVDCAACGLLVPVDRVRILASRDDLAFVELDCPGCNSDSLGILLVTEAGGDPADGSDSALLQGEFRPVDQARFRDAPPIDADDVLAVHEFLAAHGGDLRTLVGRRSDESGPDHGAVA